MGTGIPTFPAVATKGEGVLETFRELLRLTYRGLDARHDFAQKFGVTEEDFLKGVRLPASRCPSAAVSHQ